MVRSEIRHVPDRLAMLTRGQVCRCARPALRCVVSGVVLLACNLGPPAAPIQPRAESAGTSNVEIVSCVDLPRDDPSSHNLSGIAWDSVEHLLYAISDRERQITVLRPRPGFTGYDAQPPIPLDIDVEPWDGEALAIAGDRFLVVANETKQAVFSVDRSGHGAVPVALPPYPGIRNNLGFEGLGYIASAEGQYVFVVNEEALEGDGPTSTFAHGTTVRILRHPVAGGDDVEIAYLTEPVFADGVQGENGGSDLAPLTPDRVLVLERAYVRGAGNAIRIYEVDLRATQNIIMLGDARAVVPVAKRLVLDLALIPDERCAPPPQSQRRRSLENYEGLALGPTLDDGRRLIFLVSDDNASAGQVPRLVAVALTPSTL
jgi:hypothetical protein